MSDEEDAQGSKSGSDENETAEEARQRRSRLVERATKTFVAHAQKSHDDIDLLDKGSKVEIKDEPGSFDGLQHLTKSEVTPKARAPSAGRAEPEQKKAGQDLVALVTKATPEPERRPARPRSDRFNQ